MKTPDEIDATALAAVCGGSDAPNKTIVTMPSSSRVIERTDDAYCVDTVDEACGARSKRWWGRIDKQAKAQRELDELPRVCGLPPS